MVSFLLYTKSLTLNTTGKQFQKEDTAMKGYYTENGYMGYVEGRYILFASESEYYDYLESRREEQ